MSFFKATVRKLTELPLEDLAKLFKWPSKANLAAHVENPNLIIAKASRENGETVVYVVAEPIMLVDGYVLSPTSTHAEHVQAGNYIDLALAERCGTQRIWMQVPAGAQPVAGERTIRICERKVFQPATKNPVSGCELKPQPIRFQN